MDFFMSHFQLNIKKGKNLLNKVHVITATVNHKQNKVTNILWQIHMAIHEAKKIWQHSREYCNSSNNSYSVHICLISIALCKHNHDLKQKKWCLKYTAKCFAFYIKYGYMYLSIFV